MIIAEKTPGKQVPSVLSYLVNASAFGITFRFVFKVPQGLCFPSDPLWVNKVKENETSYSVEVVTNLAQGQIGANSSRSIHYIA